MYQYTLLCIIYCLVSINTLYAYPIEFIDDSKNSIHISTCPDKVVSLVPSISEIITHIGAGSHLKGTTYHHIVRGERALQNNNGIKSMGGFFSPMIDRILAIQPDVIFISSLHDHIRQRLSPNTQIIHLKTVSIEDNLNEIMLLGEIFNQKESASQLVAQILSDLDHIQKKVERIPMDKRKRVIRMMGLSEPSVPGDDSFQNDLIRAAGGIPPQFGKNGAIITITPKEWQRFNAQVIYGCNDITNKFISDHSLFKLPEWQHVDAIQNNLIFDFPCELTCRASTHTGYFASWLSAVIYSEEFAQKKYQIHENKEINSRPITIPLLYIKNARIVYSYINDFINKTFLMELSHPMTILSSLDGTMSNITTVGNHYIPPPCWGLDHGDVDDLNQLMNKIIGKPSNQTSLLITGADMDNLAIAKESFQDIIVYAFVTAGVGSNALRTAHDIGHYYEPGTINIIIATNTKLSSRAMTRAMITVTEAKTSVLLDLDIRSSYNRLNYRATGTGTDNILIVQGMGQTITMTGGHTKMGELIAKAVYQGVKEAILRQNGINAQRDIFKRLEERRITPMVLAGALSCNCQFDKNELASTLEHILHEPKYVGFIESAMAISDDHTMNLINDLSLFKAWSQQIASDIAGQTIIWDENILTMDSLPSALKIALSAFIQGAKIKIEKKKKKINFK